MDPDRSTWLPQHARGGDAVILGDWPAGPTVRVECAPCGREGRYALARLVARFGPGAELPSVLATLSADCPRRQDWRQDGPCQAVYPDLTP